MKTASIRAEWEGRTVDGRFALLEWRGGSDDRGVFLTLLRGTQRAAIKLIEAEGTDAETYIAQWEAAKDLSHPHLMGVLDTGRCAIEGMELVYVVTDYAEDSLAQMIEERALDEDEVRAVLDPVLDALAYLHGNGWVHGRVKPSNILISCGTVKLSADDLLLAGGVGSRGRKPGAYDAPEVAAGSLTGSADVWSVGMTVVGALTQRPLVWEPRAMGEPAVPASVPMPFRRIARECLRLDPSERTTIDEIKSRLEFQTPAAVAEEPMRPAAEARFADPDAVEAEQQELSHRPVLFRDIEDGIFTRASAMPVILVALLVLGIVAGLAYSTYRLKVWPWPVPVAQATTPTQPQTGADDAGDAGAGPTGDAGTAPTGDAGAAPAGGDKAQQTPAPMEGQSTPPAKDEPAPQTQAAMPAAGGTSRSNPTKNAAPVETQPPAHHASAEGTVAKRVFPDVPPGVMQSIRGSKQAVVRVWVDSSGRILRGTYVSPGPGSYLARVALRTALLWQFTPPSWGGRPRPSVWTLRFYFLETKTEVSATEERE